MLGNLVWRVKVILGTWVILKLRLFLGQEEIRSLNFLKEQVNYLTAHCLRSRGPKTSFFNRPHHNDSGKVWSVGTSLPFQLIQADLKAQQAILKSEIWLDWKVEALSPHCNSVRRKRNYFSLVLPVLKTEIEYEYSRESMALFFPLTWKY